MLTELLPQRPTVDPQNAGRRRPILTALRKDRFQQGRLDHVEESLIKIGTLAVGLPLPLLFGGPIRCEPAKLRLDGRRTSRQERRRWWKMLGIDFVSASDNRGPFDGVSQLANIAVPGSGNQLFHGGFRQPLRQPVARGQPEEMRGEQGDIVGPRSKRRQMNMKHTQR